MHKHPLEIFEGDRDSGACRRRCPWCGGRSVRCLSARRSQTLDSSEISYGILLIIAIINKSPLENESDLLIRTDVVEEASFG